MFFFKPKESEQFIGKSIQLIVISNVKFFMEKQKKTKKFLILDNILDNII